ncbi:MAG: recombination mediator RecR [Streptococcaceae bacterium]|jgi:recombination protein RecR|nr:recombination mediator RecR [Streptococcaceae bacterium]
MLYPRPLAMLIDSFMKLPGIGEKTATRLAFYVVEMQDEDVNQFAKSLLSAKRDLTFCAICGDLTEESPCSICTDSSREQTTILVVEEAKDIVAMENMREYHGLYHVLHGTISPMDGTGPEDINATSLIQRLQNSKIEEVIIGTNATVEGEATAMFLARLIKPSGIKVTRLAHGLSVGSNLEYADEITLLKAVEGRREI